MVLFYSKFICLRKVLHGNEIKKAKIISAAPATDGTGRIKHQNWHVKDVSSQRHKQSNKQTLPEKHCIKLKKEIRKWLLVPVLMYCAF